MIHRIPFFTVTPPYVHDARGDAKAYGYEMTNAEHAELAKLFNEVRGMVAVSNYQCDLMDELYPPPKWYKSVSGPRTNHATKGTRIEVLWTNYAPAAMAKMNGDQLLFRDS